MKSSEIRASRFAQLQKAIKCKEWSPDSHELLEDPYIACIQADNFVPKVTTHKAQLSLLDRGRQKKNKKGIPHVFRNAPKNQGTFWIKMHKQLHLESMIQN